MKPLKYTVAALALLAAASFSSAQASTPPAAGDLILGFQNSSTSLEFDLGAYNTLTPGETFNLGTTIESQLGSGPLTWNIAAGATTTQAAGGLAIKEVVFTAASIGTFASSTSTSVFTNLGTEVNNYGSGTAVAGANYQAMTIDNSNNASFAKVLSNNLGNYGFTSTAGTFGASFPDTTDIFTLYDKKNGSASVTAVGTFQFSVVDGNDILTFDPVAVPEPSTYALGLCAVALFFVLRRRNNVA